MPIRIIPYQLLSMNQPPDNGKTYAFLHPGVKQRLSRACDSSTISKKKPYQPYLNFFLLSELASRKGMIKKRKEISSLIVKACMRETHHI